MLPTVLFAMNERRIAELASTEPATGNFLAKVIRGSWWADGLWASWS